MSDMAVHEVNGHSITLGKRFLKGVELPSGKRLTSLVERFKMTGHTPDPPRRRERGRDDEEVRR